MNESTNISNQIRETEPQRRDSDMRSMNEPENMAQLLIECQNYTTELSRAKSEIQALKEANKKLQEELEERQAELGKSQAELEKSQAELEKCQIKLKDCISELWEHGYTIRDYKTKVGALEAALRNSIAVDDMDIENGENKSAAERALEKQLNDFGNEKKKLKKEKENLSKQVSDLEQKVRRLERTKSDRGLNAKLSID